ncbi:hypothetical protein Bca101_050042 [Brassica carinata]
MSISGNSTLLQVQTRPMPKKYLEKETSERRHVHAKGKGPATDKPTLMPTEASNVSPSGFQSQIAINPSGSRRSRLSCQTKAMEGSSEPAKLWFSATIDLLRYQESTRLSPGTKMNMLNVPPAKSKVQSRDEARSYNYNIKTSRIIKCANCNKETGTKT